MKLNKYNWNKHCNSNNAINTKPFDDAIKAVQLNSLQSIIELLTTAHKEILTDKVVSTQKAAEEYNYYSNLFEQFSTNAEKQESAIHGCASPPVRGIFLGELAFSSSKKLLLILAFRLMV